MEMISSLRCPTTTDSSEVGGKAASLFRLARHGLRVPDFFVIPVEAFQTVADGVLSTALKTEICQAWEQLDAPSGAYAVRSSAIAEDSADDSYAGIFETVLNLKTADEIIGAVEHCYTSLNSVRAESYRRARPSDKDNAMAVVVQAMVEPTWSGVCFTADPTALALSTTVISVVPGLGEQLVSGEVNPEQAKLDSSSQKVIERIVPTEVKAAPDELLIDVFEVSHLIAEAFGFPQDVEWAFDGESLYVLQSRPITTLRGVFYNRFLEPWSGTGDPDNPKRLWTRAYADEIWTPPTSPLFYDTQYLGGQIESYLSMHGDKGPYPPDIFKYYRAAPYLDSAMLLRTHSFLPRAWRSAALINTLPPEIRRDVAETPWRWWGMVKRTWKFEITHGNRWGFTRNHSYLKNSWPEFVCSANELMDNEVRGLSDAELEDHIGSIWQVAKSISSECGITVFYYAYELKLLLTSLLSRWFGNGEDLYARVSSGLEGSNTVRESQRIWEFGQRIRELGGIGESVSWIDFQDQEGRWTPLRKDISVFLNDHRHRGATYKDLVHPRWGDQPELLWIQIKASAGTQSRSPIEVNQERARARHTAQEELLDSLNGFTDTWRKSLLKWLFHYNEIYMGLRDDHRFYYDMIWWLLRRAYLEKGTRLACASKLCVPDDVFYLVRSEIDALASDSLSGLAVSSRVDVRRNEWEHTRRQLPPKFLRGPYIHGSNAPITHYGEILGLAASTGQATGRARVLYDISEISRLQEGDILVTRQTDPAWTPIFTRLAGLVLETGGTLAHGASLCREFGIPCVTSVEGATELIRDGTPLNIDGGLGSVKILERYRDIKH